VQRRHRDPLRAATLADGERFSIEWWSTLDLKSVEVLC
jgi:hypothetical protein